MKYELKTEINANGNKVFSKERKGHQFIYLARNQDGKVGKVDKAWILKNKANIINLAVSGESLIVSENVEKKKANTSDLTREAASIVKSYYAVVSKFGLVPEFDSSNETDGITEIGVGGTNIDHYFDETINGFDLSAIDDEYKKLAQYWDADAELVEFMNYFMNDYGFHMTGEGVRNAAETLSNTVKQIDEHSERLKMAYRDLNPWHERWMDLCRRFGKEKIIGLLEDEYSIYELI